MRGANHPRPFVPGLPEDQWGCHRNAGKGNESTVLKAQSEAVKEIGKVSPCLLQYMHNMPEGLHILFSKLVISNWFWCFVVQEADSYNFAYVLPQ